MRHFILSLLFVLSVVDAAVADAPASCAGLSRDDCFESAHCLVECGKKTSTYCEKYICREKQGECENVSPQSKLTREVCEKLTNCRYSPPTCYCPEKLLCTCGGGSPAQCSSR
ncbi:MAG: hypothetical protein U0136_06320 [Bdellovibrionota bacterium]